MATEAQIEDLAIEFAIVADGSTAPGSVAKWRPRAEATLARLEAIGRADAAWAAP